MAQLSTAWLLSKEGVTAPIIGPSSLEKLKDNIGGSCMVYLSALACSIISFPKLPSTSSLLKRKLNTLKSLTECKLLMGTRNGWSVQSSACMLLYRETLVRHETMYLEIHALYTIVNQYTFYFIWIALITSITILQLCMSSDPARLIRLLEEFDLI